MMHRPTSPGYLLGALILGLALGAAWDLIGILNLPLWEPCGRRAERIGAALWRGLSDLFFCLLSAVSFSILTYALNRGKIRALALLSMACGFSLWYFSLSGRLRALARRGQRILRRLTHRICDATFGRLADRLIRVARRAYTKQIAAELARRARCGRFGPNAPKSRCSNERKKNPCAPSE